MDLMIGGIFRPAIRIRLVNGKFILPLTGTALAGRMDSYTVH